MVGELAKGNSQNKIIQFQHIAIEGASINLFIKYSKTDQCGLGTNLSIQAIIQISCLVQAIINCLQARPNGPGFLFCHYSGKPLSRYQFSSVLSKTLNLLGIDSKLYQSHIFRIGSATTRAFRARHSVIWPKETQCLETQCFQIFYKESRCPLQYYITCKLGHVI